MCVDIVLVSPKNGDNYIWPLCTYILPFLDFEYILSLYIYGLLPIFYFFTSGLYLFLLYSFMAFTYILSLFFFGLYLYSVIILFWPLPIFCFIHFWPLPIFCLYSFLSYFAKLVSSVIFCNTIHLRMSATKFLYLFSTYLHLRTNSIRTYWKID